MNISQSLDHCEQLLLYWHRPADTKAHLKAHLDRTQHWSGREDVFLRFLRSRLPQLQACRLGRLDHGADFEKLAKTLEECEFVRRKIVEMVFDADIDTFLEKLKSKLLKEFDIENGEILRIEKGSVRVFIRLERTQSERILDAKDQWGDFLLKDVRVLKTSSATTR